VNIRAGDSQQQPKQIRTFGKYGSGPGEFDCLAGIATNKYRQLVVTDRYNHRVQIFEWNGRFVREFGSHGQTNGIFI
jgi:tripartite motif-containing protein 71